MVENPRDPQTSPEGGFLFITPAFRRGLPRKPTIPISVLLYKHWF